MVVDTLIYHPTLSKLIKFWDSTLKERKLLDYYHIYQDFLVIMLIKGYSKETIELWSN